MERAIALILLGLAGVAMTASAGDEIYRTTDEHGNVVYTDEPPSEDAEPVDLEPLTTVPAPEDTGGAEAADDEGRDSAEAAVLADGLQIAYPPDDEAIRHNGGNVPFRVQLQPEGAQLPAGHRIEIVLDGEVRAIGTGGEIVVSPVIRGPHTARARLVDGDGEPRLASEPVDFYLLRATIGNEPDRGLQGRGDQGQQGQGP